jgi:1,4-dihydroxy-2-naphthoate octaprenyltransferase
MKNEKLKAWIHAARLRTLPLSIAGVLLGSMIAYSDQQFHWDVFILALLTTLLLQILSNLANDYGDFTHGTDNGNRVGPERAVQSGIISPTEMKRAMYIIGLLAFHAGMFLITAALDELFSYIYILFLITGLVAIGSAIKYTVGKRNFGYKGFGDVMVFLFFGIVAVSGTHFLHTLHFDAWILLPAISVGLLSAGVLNINNMRDVENDRIYGKITVPVRLGTTASKWYHLALLAVSILTMEIFLIHKSNIMLSITIVAPAFLLLLHGITVARNKEPRLLDAELKKLALTTLLLSVWCGIGLIL